MSISAREPLETEGRTPSAEIAERHLHTDRESQRGIPGRTQRFVVAALVHGVIELPGDKVKEANRLATQRHEVGTVDGWIDEQLGITGVSFSVLS